MLDDSKWVRDVLVSAMSQNESIPESLGIEIEALLAGKFSQRAIPAMELANIARQLLTAMEPADPPQAKPE
jgi:hypothetical protein